MIVFIFLNTYFLNVHYELYYTYISPDKIKRSVKEAMNAQTIQLLLTERYP